MPENLAMLVGVVNGPGAFSPYLNYENAIQPSTYDLSKFC